MALCWIVFLLTLVVFTLVPNPATAATLEHVHVIFRHGDRSPVAIYPNDPHKESEWGISAGQLTWKGVEQHFQLGQWLRKRYNGILSDHYNSTELLVRSTDVDRTLMSAEANVAGLYYNHSKDIADDIHWRPVPVHTTSSESDELLVMDNCPQYIALRNGMVDKEPFKSRLAVFIQTISLAQKMTGWTNFTVRDAWKLADCLFCEKVHNMTWPDWVTPQVYANISKMDSILWEMEFYGDELPRLSGGLLLWNIISHMNSVISGNLWRDVGHRMVIYSAHDTDVAALLAALKVYNNMQPPYASALLIELWYEGDVESDRIDISNWSVKLQYKNSTPPEDFVYALTMPGCNISPESLCPFSLFQQSTSHATLSPNDYKSACAVKPIYHRNWLLYLLIAFATITLAALVLSIVYFLCIQKKYRFYRRLRPADGDIKECIN